MSLQSQKAAILAHLKTGRSITPRDAVDGCGSYRLGARIEDLKQDGHNIGKDMVQTERGKRVASYTLVHQ